MRISILNPNLSAVYSNPSHVFLIILALVALLALVVYVARSARSSSNLIIALVMCVYLFSALIISSALSVQSIFFAANKWQIAQLLFFWVSLSTVLVYNVGRFFSKVKSANIIIIQQAIIVLACVFPLVSFKFVSILLVLESINFFIVCYLIYLSAGELAGIVQFMWVSLAFNLSLIFSWVVLLADTYITCGGYYLGTSSEIASFFLFLAIGIKIGLYPVGSWILNFYMSLDTVPLIGYFISAYIPTLLLCMALILSILPSLHLPSTSSIYTYIVIALVCASWEFGCFASFQSASDGMSIILGFLTLFLATSTMLLLLGCLVS